MFGEVQVNSPEMIYAKEKESIGRKMLGDKKYDEIAKRIGIKGGLGHKLFDEWRSLNDEIDLLRKKEIQNQSKQYYSHFFKAMIMKSNFEILQEEISKGKTVYFEWEFEEIALKYLGDGNYEAKNKGYGGPFSVKFNAMLVAEALLSNPRIINKQEYDNY